MTASTTGSSAAPDPHRLTPTQRLHEVTLAFASRTASPPEHAAEVTRNAKGVAQFTVTVRGYDLADVIAGARAKYDELVTAYPYPAVNGGAE